MTTSDPPGPPDSIDGNIALHMDFFNWVTHPFLGLVPLPPPYIRMVPLPPPPPPLQFPVPPPTVPPNWALLGLPAIDPPDDPDGLAGGKGGIDETAGPDGSNASAPGGPDGSPGDSPGGPDGSPGDSPGGPDGSPGDSPG